MTSWSGEGLSSAYSVHHSLVDATSAVELQALASRQSFDMRPDSVDAQPAHELYIFRDGVTALAELHAKMKPMLARFTSLANQRMPVCQSASTHCRPCTSLIRRYRPGERRAHYEHIDGHAAVTVVVSLSPQALYTGGLFVSNLSSRILLPLQRGDAVMHASDLFHGVDVRSGERWSWVVWYRTCSRCTLEGSTSWYRQRAEVRSLESSRRSIVKPPQHAPSVTESLVLYDP